MESPVLRTDASGISGERKLQICESNFILKGDDVTDRGDQIRLIKEANDIVALVGGYLSLEPRGQTYKGLCPFHDDRSPSLDVDPRRQRYRCWSCGKFGDVFSFIQEQEHVSFREALELLARRAGIALDEKSSDKQQSRGQLLDVMRWAFNQYHYCYLEDDLAEKARAYLTKRHLLGPTVRKFGVGFAPGKGDWLVQRAKKDSVPFSLLEQLGLIGQSSYGSGHYDRFRDRVLFPIRDPMGRPLGFGGRILPGSPLEGKGPKYYNSPDTPLFSKKEVIYGLDLARGQAQKQGMLAVVEGYTDVLMAHQCGVENVVATMGTALTDQHVRSLRRLVSRVVLVYDADIGGESGVDRALELFASQEVDLAIATLPEGLDPCDLLNQEEGPQRFHQCLDQAFDALDFKLQRALASGQAKSVEGQRRAVDEVLKIIALAPELPGQAGALKQELIVTRIRHRLGLSEQVIWARLQELRQQHRQTQPRARHRADQPEAPVREANSGSQKSAPSTPEERQLLEVLLADPDLVAVAAEEVAVEEIKHPGLRKLLAGLYALREENLPPTLDQLRPRLDNPRLAEWALKQQEVGQECSVDRSQWLEQILLAFRQRRAKAEKRVLQSQLSTANDHEAALQLLQQVQASAEGVKMAEAQKTLTEKRI